MRAVVVLPFVLGFAGAAAAQPAPRTLPEVVRGVEARYNAARTMKATFLEVYREGHGDLRVESGTVYFRKPGRMRWEYESPEEKLFLSDGKRVWFYVPADRSVTRAPVKESDDWHTPLALLAGRAKFSRICGRVELADARVAAPGNLVLRCLPRAPPKDLAHTSRTGSQDAELVPAGPFQEVLLEVDAAYRLVKVVIRETGGIETEFRFANWVENLPLAETMFRFQAPPGVAIVEEPSASGPGR